MMCPAPSRAALLLLLVLAPCAADAQTGWDPQAYTSAIESGRSQHELAMSEPEGSVERRDLLVASLSAERQAQQMLREAILSGAVDAFREDAITELFNLTDNIVVTMFELGECEVAASEVTALAAEPALNPPDADPHIEILRQAVVDCRARRASAPVPFDPAAYERAEQRADDWRQQAAAAAVRADREAALYETAMAEAEALRLLRTAALAGQPTPGIEPAARLAVHYNRLVVGLLEMELCRGASNRLVERDATLDELGATGARSDYARELADCRSAATARADAEVDIDLPPPVTVVEDRTNPWPWLLIGLGSGAAVAAIALDISLIGDRDEFDDQKQRCDNGTDCNYEALDLLGSSIDRQRIVIAVLAGVAVVSGTTGLIWALTSDDERDPRPSATLELAPMATPTTFGAALTFTH